MDELQQHMLRIADVTRDANYAFWNALLTLNGIVVSVFSAVAVFSPGAKVLTAAIIIISMLSAILVIFNFRSTRNQYRLIGQVGEGGIEHLSLTERKRQIDESIRRHSWCNRREATAYHILAIQAILILILIYFKS